MSDCYVAFVVRVLLENIHSAPRLLGKRRKNYTDWNPVLVPSVTSLLDTLPALGPLVGNIENFMREFNTTEPIREFGEQFSNSFSNTLASTN